MINPFLGGWLFHPAAVDLIADTCLNNCSYCFTEINKKNMTPSSMSSIKSAIKKLYFLDESMESYFINQNFPLCVSNLTDMFSPNNHNNAIALFTHLQEKSNGIFIQTKGCKNFFDVFAPLNGKKEIVIYLTITTLREEVARVQEPGAPTVKERFEIAEGLSKLGYSVAIALNPLSAQWICPNELPIYAQMARDAGVDDIIIELLDISPGRKKRLTQSRIDRLGPALNDPKGKADYEMMRTAVIYFVENGFNVSKSGMPFRTEIFNKWEKILKKVIPNNQKFINYAIDNKLDTLYFSDYIKIIDSFGLDLDYNHGHNKLRSYLLRANTRIWKKYRYIRINNFRELLRVCWNEKRLPTSMQRYFLCYDTGRIDSDGNVIIGFQHDAPKLKQE